MIARVLGYAGLGFGASLLLIPPWRNRFDFYVFRHYRNWRENLDDWGRFQTQEEFYAMLKGVTSGTKQLFFGENKPEV